MASFPLQLTGPQKDTLDDISDEIKQFDWETGEYVFHEFVDYFQLPQIILVSQTWDTNLTKNDVLYLHSIYDRHLIITKSLQTDAQTFIIPDWFDSRCRVLSNNPVYKPRSWEFHSAVDFLRFQMPRSGIRLLNSVSAFIRSSTGETVSVIIKENTELTLKSIEKISTANGEKEMVILSDKHNQDFLLDPTDPDNIIHFSIKILEQEYDSSYLANAQDTFSLPEILIRYELPIDIEFVSITNPVPINQFPTKLRLEKYAIGKSIIGFSIGDNNNPKILEFSSLTQFSLRCIKCLTTNLPRDSSAYEEPQSFDKSAYQHYESVRDRLVQLFDDVSLHYIRTPFIGNSDELESINKVHELGKALQNDDRGPTYTLREESNKANQPETTMVTPSIDKHPHRFTVHLPVDLHNPYSNTMDVDDGDEDEQQAE